MQQLTCFMFLFSHTQQAPKTVLRLLLLSGLKLFCIWCYKTNPNSIGKIQEKEKLDYQYQLTFHGHLCFESCSILKSNTNICEFVIFCQIRLSRQRKRTTLFLRVSSERNGVYLMLTIKSESSLLCLYSFIHHCLCQKDSNCSKLHKSKCVIPYHQLTYPLSRPFRH